MQAQSGRSIDQEILDLSGGLFEAPICEVDRTGRYESLAARALTQRRHRRALWIAFTTAAAGTALSLTALILLVGPTQTTRAARESRGATVMTAVLTTAVSTAQAIDTDKKDEKALKDAKVAKGEASGEAPQSAASKPAEATSARPSSSASAKGSSRKAALSAAAATRRRRGTTHANEAPKVGPIVDAEEERSEAESADRESADAERPHAKEPAAPREEVGINKDAVSTAIAIAAGRASSCLEPTETHRSMLVNVTFMPTGHVTMATVNSGPFAGTVSGGCIARALRSAVVGPFEGPPVTVSTFVRIR